MKDVQNMTRKEFDALPYRGSFDSMIKDEIYSIVILPQKSRHDSGYRLLDFVACGKNAQPICKLSGCSDVLHIEGIGGYGIDHTFIKQQIPVSGWSIDCLPTSGLLRIFCDKQISVGAALSSFEIYSIRRKDR